MKWNMKYIKQLESDGRIRGYVLHKKEAAEEVPGRIVTKHFAKRSKEKDWIGWNLLVWCESHCVQLMEEYRFDPERKWRADYAIPELKLLIEYEGLFSDRSRHTTASGFTGDTEKYNQAQALGWTVLRFTALNYKTMIAALNKHKKR